MSEQHMNLDQRWKTWGGFLRLMTYSAVAIAIALLIMWWAIV